MPDPYNLQRFIEAQTGVYRTALGEISSGHKRSHWMWFIFPQLLVLGRSAMSQKYAIASLSEAEAYLAHPVLGQRLGECVTALQDLPSTAADEVFGAIDAAKLRSSLTLFIRAGGGSLFEAALQRWFSGEADKSTDRLLRAKGAG